MSNVWILTIGGSDVRLKSNKNWNSLRSAALDFLKPDREFKPEPENTLIGIKFILPSRVLGTVYGSVIDQNFQDLDFPLLDNFLQKFNDEEVALEKVFIFLTDQEEFFAQDSKLKSCHFWNDTSALKPIISEYLKQRLNISVENQDFRILKPKGTTEGLDDWNAVLNIVQEEISELSIHPESTIYVSHQAGTPAMSSAVQFVCLTRFGKQVNFLLGSEGDAKLTKFIPSPISTYLHQLKVKEVEILLKSYDYSGVKSVLGIQNKELDLLLDSAILWNFAEFKKFNENLMDSIDFPRSSQKVIDPLNWWLQAYESAYLAVIRLKQGNTVEAMFHSFRAVEGLMKKYVEDLHNDPSIAEIELNGKTIIFHLGNNTKPKKYNSYGFGLYNFLSDYRNIDNTEIDIYEFGENVFKERNELFHNLIGLDTALSVFKKWNTQNEEEWKHRVCGCLNFISGQTFTTLEEASIMPTVHKELVAAIASLAQPPS
jgi:hypothetical protein